MGGPEGFERRGDALVRVNNDAEMAPNQHHEAINVESTRVMLLSMLDYWEKAGCDCCAPSILDEAIEKIGPDPALWDRMRKFALELATAAQWQIDYWRMTRMPPEPLMGLSVWWEIPIEEQR